MIAATNSRPSLAGLLLVGAATAFVACHDGTPRLSSPVSIRVATTPSLASVGGPLVLTGLRLSVGQASLGSADQFGCQDCSDQGSESSSPGSAVIVDVPVDGGAVVLNSEPVGAGRYDSVEIELRAPGSAAAGWTAGATVEVTGTYNGVSFILAIPVAGAHRAVLAPPLDVAAGASPAQISVTIRLPVASWFDNAGAVLNPADATQRAMIEANARRSLQALESDSMGGER